MPSSGRFQSHLLSSLSQQSLRWRDQIGRSLRRAKVFTLWTTQIVLYPIYVAFQSARVMGRQLQQAQTWADKARHLLQWLRRSPSGQALPKSDTPLRRVLKAAIAETDLTPRSPTSYGLATHLDTHELVLTDIHQGIVAFFSAQQQHKLRQHIVWEMATYWRTQRLLEPVPQLLPLPVERPAMFPPVRAFWRLMAWVQVSPVAIATNLFQEAKLVTELQTQLVHIPQISTLSDRDLEQLLRPQGTEPKVNPIPEWMDPDYAIPRELQLTTVQPAQDPDIARAVADTSSDAITLSAALGGEMAERSPVITSDLATTAALKAETETMVYTPPWIETQATLVRYEKHPLERLLNWLDRGLFWIEQRLHDLWSWVCHVPRS